MSAVSIAAKPSPYQPTNKVRFVTATSLFDGHDASVNIMRRVLQASGAEVIHLGHNRSVQEIVNAALQEDVQGVAITSYQGGHVEFFKYMMDLLRENGGENIKVFGGGGGVIVPAEIRELMAYGVTRLYSPEDGAKLGLQGMIDDVIRTSDYDLSALGARGGGGAWRRCAPGNRRKLARVITAVENRTYPMRDPPGAAAGGRRHQDAGARNHRHRRRRQILADRRTHSAAAPRSERSPARRRHLDRSVAQAHRRRAARRSHPHECDRIRPDLHALAGDARYRHARSPRRCRKCWPCCKISGFDLIVVETSGIGQGESAIVPLVDTSLYVMTPEFGAASQLEKIDMLDFADFVAINKFDRKGSEDALRDVRKQYQRNHQLFTQPTEAMPVYGTMASRFNDDGVTALYQAIVPRLQEKGLKLAAGKLPPVAVKASSRGRAIVPPERVRYLAEISATLREFHRPSRGRRASRASASRSRLRRPCLPRPAARSRDFDELIAAKERRARVRPRPSCWSNGRRPRSCTRSPSTW